MGECLKDMRPGLGGVSLENKRLGVDIAAISDFCRADLEHKDQGKRGSEGYKETQFL